MKLKGRAVFLGLVFSAIAAGMAFAGGASADNSSVAPSADSTTLTIVFGQPDDSGQTIQPAKMQNSVFPQNDLAELTMNPESETGTIIPGPETAVPEPSTLLLLSLGGLALIGLRKRRKRAKSVLHSFLSLILVGVFASIAFPTNAIAEDFDFGDAPDPSYPTLSAADGARHAYDGSTYLGAGVDVEDDGQPDAQAMGDTDDGVAFLSLLTPANEAQLEVTASTDGALSLWIDWNQDGMWEQSMERVFSAPLTAGVTPITIAVPWDALSGQTFMRVRFASEPIEVEYPYGPASDGEVEDYAVTIEGFDFGDAPDPSYPTLSAADGARHAYDGSTYLGAGVDVEDDGQPDAQAMGDTDDGVAFLSLLTPANEAQLEVTASTDGALSLWIDWNQDGMWEQSMERVFSAPLTAGVTPITIAVPWDALPGQTFMRVRFASEPIEIEYPYGPASDGEVEDYAVTIEGFDFGDAPDPSYPTLSAADGARHAYDGSTYLGASVDVEDDGQPDAQAMGDTDDGVAFLSLLTPANEAQLEVTASTDGALSLWIDWNQDGMWEQSMERVFSAPLTAGVTPITIAVPWDALPGQTFMRVRFASEPIEVEYPYGPSSDGEVEDYAVTIEGFDFGDAPDPSYPTLSAADGARHAYDGSTYLGASVDVEDDGQPDAQAMGDTDDGVAFLSLLTPANEAQLEVTASTDGALSLWIDWNQDGMWEQSMERVFSAPLTAGVTPITIAVPWDALPGQTFMRVRFASEPIEVEYPYGPASNGEVEDYAVTIEGFDFGDAPDPSYPTLSAADGARHAYDGSTYLGAGVDVEDDGQPDAQAMGDTDDGVAFLSLLTPANEAQLEVTASTDGALSLWIDWNQDGMWEQSMERVFSAPLTAGVTPITIAVPWDALPGQTFMRVRFASEPIEVEYPYGPASDGEVEDYAVTVEDNGSPRVDTISPATGETTGGVEVTISGSNFGTAQGTGSVTFGGVAATSYTSWSETQIVCTTPPHAAGMVEVMVTGDSGEVGGQSTGFTYISPSIATVSPSSGPSEGGTTVTISGSNFGNAPGTITFGGVAVSHSSWSDTQIVCITPAHTVGAVDVVVTSEAGSSGTRTSAFTYQGTIADFPYSEDFEHAGTLPSGWAHDTGHDFNWRLDAGGTSSSSTGPSVDHTSGATSGYYLYTEASSPNYPSKEAGILSPSFDISSLPNPVLSFWYHMYGGAMGTLHVDLLSEGVWFTDVMTPLSGDHGNVWQQQFVDLSAYSGVIQLRFRGVTGSSYTSDMAIDDLSIADMLIPPVVNDVSPDAGPADSTTVVTINGSNFGETQGSGTVTLDGLAASSYISWSETQIVCETPQHAAGAVDVLVTADTGESGTLTSAFTYKGVIVTFPYVVDFEHSGTIPEEWDHGTGADFNWRINLGKTPSSGTGPSGDHTSETGTGYYYLYAEASSPNFPSKEARILSPYFDISELSAPGLEFWFHMYGNQMGTLHIDLLIDGVWQTDIMTPISGNQGDVWQKQFVDLSAYSGVIQLRFRGVTGSSYTSDIAIDDISLVSMEPALKTAVLSADSTSYTLPVMIWKSGTGSGTIVAGGQQCGPDCQVVSVPYNQGDDVTVRVTPAADSSFSGWETVDGTSIDGIHYAKPGETLYAVFELR